MDAQKDLQWILNALRSYHPTPKVDIEQLAIDIWLQYCHGENRKPTWVELRSRFIDAYRRERVRYCEVLPDEVEHRRDERELDEQSRRTKVAQLMGSVRLDREQRQIIHDLYYAGKSVVETATLRRLSQTRVRELHSSALLALKRAAMRTKT